MCVLFVMADPPFSTNHTVFQRILRVVVFPSGWWMVPFPGSMDRVEAAGASEERMQKEVEEW